MNVNFLFILSLYCSPLFATEICFYKDENYNDESFCSNQGVNNDFLADFWNDSISSITIPLGMEVTVYEDDNFTGRYTTLTGDTNYDKLELFALNNEISSYKVSPAACLYSKDNFQDGFICLSPEQKINFNEPNSISIANVKINSISVPDAMKVIIYNGGCNANPIYITQNTLKNELEKNLIEGGSVKIKAISVVNN